MKRAVMGCVAAALLSSLGSGAGEWGVACTASTRPPCTSSPRVAVPFPTPPPNSQQSYLPNTPYDGRFTFVRIRFEPLGGDEGFRGRDVKWDHDYPRGERHFQRILHELTTISTHLDESNILALDDPELMKYPVAYMSEPGFWSLSDKEAEGLRTYLQKGGFIIFDDFAGPHWYNFAEQFRKAMPDAQLVPLDSSHAIFDSFFHIESLDFDHPYYRVKSQFFGVFEDNDPQKRLIAIANYNNDIGDYWEWSDEGFLPIALSNQAYRLGVNYVVYAMTH